MQIEAEILRKFTPLEDVIEEAELEWSLTCYMPPAVSTAFNSMHEHQEFWRNDKRHVTVLYINPNLVKADILNAAAGGREAKKWQDVVSGVQHSLHQFEGELIKVMNDDTECMIVAAFGLAPMSHPDDALRAVIGSAVRPPEAMEALSLKSLMMMFRLGLASPLSLKENLAICHLVGPVSLGRPFPIFWTPFLFSIWILKGSTLKRNLPKSMH